MTTTGISDDSLGGNRSGNWSQNGVDISKVATPATMFVIGVLGNGIAILVLSFSHNYKKESTFYTLVCGLAVTDLLGTCLTSPIVICTYLAGYQWPGGQPLCEYFSFMLLFFGAAGMCILCAMAVERYLAINHAYFYRDNVDKQKARVALLVIYLFNVLFCALPSMGFGRNVFQDPPTWCYLDWRTSEPRHATYVYAYACFVAGLVLVTVVCNVRVCSALVAMMRRADRPPNLRGSHMSKMSGVEIQMFCLLVIITLIFLICSLPLVIRIFVNQIYKPEVVSNLQENPDLLAIRFASFNPILNPWVYILCRRKLLPYVTHFFRQLICKFDEGSLNKTTSQRTRRRAREASIELRSSIHWTPTLSKPIFHGNNVNML
uniref:prostaglandin E2 receptor EP4 subtype-like n=1 Tax=Myxine glutinosa TaxID=7769 RepID=UPI00358F811D